MKILGAIIELSLFMGEKAIVIWIIAKIITKIIKTDRFENVCEEETEHLKTKDQQRAEWEDWIQQRDIKEKHRIEWEQWKAEREKESKTGT